MLSGQMPPLQRCIMTSSRATFSPQTHGREALVCSVISDVHNCQMSSWTRKQSTTTPFSPVMSYSVHAFSALCMLSLDLVSAFEFF
eukprot:m.315192 g.315192  ORF g.315192 m.315192 type:complete len:86 (+) comp15973_c0_seq27:5684-5941(+)